MNWQDTLYQEVRYEYTARQIEEPNISVLSICNQRSSGKRTITTVFLSCSYCYVDMREIRQLLTDIITLELKNQPLSTCTRAQKARGNNSDHNTALQLYTLMTKNIIAKPISAANLSAKMLLKYI